jgi:hypothetical protein
MRASIRRRPRSGDVAATPTTLQIGPSAPRVVAAAGRSVEPEPRELERHRDERRRANDVGTGVHGGGS